VDQARQTNDLPLDVAAYVAGLIDGEGTVTLTRLHADENRRLVVSIANTDLKLLQFVMGNVGAGKITRKRTISGLHTPSYCYVLASRQALALLQQVWPYLHTYKRHRAELALQHYQALTPRNGKYSPSLLAKRRKFEPTLLQLRPGRN
jgi:hypothetical protein